MANHIISNPAVYSEVLRKIETTDPVHADVINPVFTQLINNDAALKAILDHTTSKQYATVLEKMTNGEAVKIVCYGDSITAANYPAELQTILRDFYQNVNITVVNRGYSARQSDELLSDTYLNIVIADNADLVIYMSGINDCFGNPDYGFGGVVPVANYMANILDINRKLGSVPMIIMTPTPTWGGYTGVVTDENKRDRIYIYAEAVRALGRLTGMKVVDTWEGVIKNYLYRVFDVHAESSDLVHYTSAGYKRIAEFIFASALTNVDLIVKEDRFFPVIHSIFNYHDSATGTIQANNQASPHYYCALLSSLADIWATKATAYVFIDAPKADLILSNIVWITGSDINEITIDGVTQRHSNWIGKSTFSAVQWEVPTFIKTLTYGLHKIEFKAVAGALAPEVQFMLGFNGMEFKVDKKINDTIGNNVNVYAPTMAYTTGATKTLFQGIEKLTFNANPTTIDWLYKKVFTLGKEVNKHYRLYMQVERATGIGLGTVRGRNPADGKVYEAPACFIFFDATATGTGIGVSQITTLSTFAIADGRIETSLPAPANDPTMGVLDIIVKPNGIIETYWEGAALQTITPAKHNPGVLDLWLWNKSMPTRTTPQVVTLTKIEELPFGVAAPGVYEEGTRYYDSLNNVEKVYDGTTWKIITMS